MANFTLTINGKKQQVDVDPATPLLWVLRDRLDATGTKYGCGIAQCGACTVHLDGQPVRACQTRLGDVGTAQVTTIEGVSGRVAEAVQAAWRKLERVASKVFFFLSLPLHGGSRRGQRGHWCREQGCRELFEHLAAKVSSNLLKSLVWFW